MMSVIDHIAILVDNLSVAEEWYTQKLAGKVTFRNSSRWNNWSLCKRPIWKLFRVYLVF
jgi:hypothetical protein